MKQISPDQETCLKPIGPLANLIESMSMAEYALFIVACAKLSVQNKSIFSNDILIGLND